MEPNSGGNRTMGLDNPIHIAFLLILLLLVFGAKRLPEMGQSLGAGMRGFKDSLSGESTHASLAAQQPPATTVAGSTAAALAPPVAEPAVAPVPEPVPAPVAEQVVAPVEEPRAPLAAA
jgi:sec-independent protein translocase protein TatA